MTPEQARERDRAQGRRYDAARYRRNPMRCKAYIERNKAIISAEAEARGGACERADCHRPYVQGVFHWHHRDEATKLFLIADFASKPWSVARLAAELAKCDLLCPDCHGHEHDQPM